MKHTIFLVFCFFYLAGCSVYNRIQTTGEIGLKTMRLNQLHLAKTINKHSGSAGHSGIKVNFKYLYQEKNMARPVISLRLKLDKLPGELTDSTITIRLGGESIQLFSSAQIFIIPENLWVPIVHSNDTQYTWIRKNEEMVIGLDEKEKDKLVEFFQRAIKYRDALFPAIPEGQKKW